MHYLLAINFNIIDNNTYCRPIVLNNCYTKIKIRCVMCYSAVFAVLVNYVVLYCLVIDKLIVHFSPRRSCVSDAFSQPGTFRTYSFPLEYETPHS